MILLSVDLSDVDERRIGGWSLCHEVFTPPAEPGYKAVAANQLTVGSFGPPSLRREATCCLPNLIDGPPEGILRWSDVQRCGA